MQTGHRGRKALIVTSQPPKARDAGERTLHDPTLLEHMKAAGPDLLPIDDGVLWGLDPSQADPGILHNLHLPAQSCFAPLDEAALLVRTIGPDQLEPREAAASAARGVLCRRHDPGCWPHGPARSRSTPWYHRADASCDLSYACHHRSRAAPFWLVFTDGLSMMAALGVGSRPYFTYPWSRNTVCIRFQVPSLRQVRK
jgi:hypothetical protein